MPHCDYGVDGRFTKSRHAAAKHGRFGANRGASDVYLQVNASRVDCRVNECVAPGCTSILLPSQNRSAWVQGDLDRSGA
jgi:hypothetical protein